MKKRYFGHSGLIILITVSSLFFTCGSDDLTASKEFSESFTNLAEWEIELQKHASDTRTKVDLVDGDLHLIAGTNDDYTRFYASALARKTISEINLDDYVEIEEITLNIKCSPFALRSFYTYKAQLLNIKIGPYVLQQYTSQPHSSIPGVVEFNFKIVVSDNNLLNGQASVEYLYKDATKS
ncbi:MAG: hypothetical protein ACOYXT_26540, partial [Bacteroidota bacterium]